MARVIALTQAVGLSLKDFNLMKHCRTLVLCKEVGTYPVFTSSIGVVWRPQILCCSISSKEKMNILYLENIFPTFENRNFQHMERFESKNYSL